MGLVTDIGWVSVWDNDDLYCIGENMNHINISNEYIIYKHYSPYFISFEFIMVFYLFYKRKTVLYRAERLKQNGYTCIE